MKLQERLLNKTPPSPFQKPAQSRNKQEWKKETAPVAKVRAHGHSRPYAFTVACTSAHTQRSKRRRFHAHKQRRISSLHKQAARAPSTRTYIHIPASRCFHNEQQRVGEQAEAFAQRTPERGPNSPDNNAKLRGGERQANERAKKTKRRRRSSGFQIGIRTPMLYTSARSTHTSPACSRTLLCLTAGHQRRASASEECTRVSAGGRKEDDRRSVVPHEKAPRPRGRGQRRDFAPRGLHRRLLGKECLGTS